MAGLAGIQKLPRPEIAAVEHWICIAGFLLTNSGWRKERGFNASVGFPPNGKAQKARVGRLLEEFEKIDGLREALSAVNQVPMPHYEEGQWTTLRHAFTVLRHAVAELRVIFAERNVVDFTELNIAAREVLGNEEASPDALLALSGNIRHFLVDEFQDTSWSQLDLLKLLIRAWDEGDGRTCFLVGDPMQSIYLFRQAEVELFELVSRHGLVSEEHTVALEPLELTTNFRSHEGLTTRWNEIFEAVFAAGKGERQVEYSQTIAAKPALPGRAVHVHPQIIGDVDRKVTPEDRAAAREDEARQVLAILHEHRKGIEEAIAQDAEYRVAVLARSRADLVKIVALLREQGVPFRAVELETLNERQELLDLMSLVRALLHPMDRVAWLSVLRAPWCGLTLPDLHILTGADDTSLKRSPMLELIESRMSMLSEDGATRLGRVAGILQQALAVRFQGAYAGSFAQWIERTWRSLGGPQCLDAVGYENAQVFFTLLDQIAPDGIACLTEDFEAEMSRLFAKPDPQVSEKAGVQLMTIHKAKGLGFDVVIVPGLDRGVKQDDAPLIASLERINPETGKTEMLVVPIGERGEDSHPTYSWVRKQHRHKLDDELKRLLYVACTRARKSLHLLGTAQVTKSGLKPGNQRSLLTTAWPALEADFEATLAARRDKVVVFPEQTGQMILFDLAAAAEPASPGPKLMLRRLPAGADLSPALKDVVFSSGTTATMEPVTERPEGSRDARQKGSVVHALLELASQGNDLNSIRIAARSLLRGLAYTGSALDNALEEALAAVQGCMEDLEGAWVLAAHTGGQSEISWTDWGGGALETIRADRSFVAGAAPIEPGESHLWIIDYKMSVPAGDKEFLKHQREMYAGQLKRYGRVLREAQGIDLPVRFGLYFPRIPRLYWWEDEAV